MSAGGASLRIDDDYRTSNQAAFPELASLVFCKSWRFWILFGQALITSPRPGSRGDPTPFENFSAKFWF